MISSRFLTKRRSMGEFESRQRDLPISHNLALKGLKPIGIKRVKTDLLATRSSFAVRVPFTPGGVSS